MREKAEQGTVGLTESNCWAQQFRDSMRQLLGSDFNEYQWLNYPVNNFGVASAYTGTKGQVKHPVARL